MEGISFVNNQKHKRNAQVPSSKIVDSDNTSTGCHSKRYDLCFFIDCADSGRAGKFSDYAKSHLSVNIDHHKSNDYFAKHNIVIPTASSTCEVMYDLMEQDGIFKNASHELHKKIANSLLTGLSTDTGHFMHSSVNAKVMQTVANLTALGGDIHEISNHLYRTKPKEKIALLGYALSNLKFYNDDTIAILSLSLTDFEKFSSSPLSTEGFIDYPLSISSVLVAITITQAEGEVYKISFRSKGTDVSVIASTFGGGGHIRASGCQIKGVYDEVLDRVLSTIRKFI